LTVLNGYSNKAIAQRLISLISDLKPKGLQFMEVCGTHTVSLSRSGIRSMLPAGLRIVSGPGCPVCVTSNSDLSKAFQVASNDRVTLATFGDMMRVPVGGDSLMNIRARGGDVRTVYSAMDAVNLETREELVFLGIGFETTSPTVAGMMAEVERRGLTNFSLLSFFKLIPPALGALLEGGEIKIDGLILPGHVSTIIGTEPYRFIVEEFGIPCAIAGFEPIDMLLAVYSLTKMKVSGKSALINTYIRSVREDGNRKALEMLEKFFEPTGSSWRGLGFIPESGLKLRPEYEHMNAEAKFELKQIDMPEPANCRCADVIKGAALPNECPLFANVCKPESPVGPCMVSSEGACAALYNYG